MARVLFADPFLGQLALKATVASAVLAIAVEGAAAVQPSPLALTALVANCDFRYRPTRGALRLDQPAGSVRVSCIQWLGTIDSIDGVRAGDRSRCWFADGPV